MTILHDSLFKRLGSIRMDRTVIPGDFNQIDPAERDLRWERVRAAMAARGIDCLLINGTSARWNEMHANIRYVCNYADPVSGEAYAIFPLNDDGTLITQFQPKRSAFAMSWFDDIRGVQAANLADIALERLEELNLTHGRLGLVGMVFRAEDNIGLPWNHLERIRKVLPNLDIVDATDMVYELRATKSLYELACLERSAGLVDIGFEAHLRLAQVGMQERELFAGVIQAMDSAGAEPPTFLLLESGPMPSATLHQDAIPSARRLEPGDVIISETSPKWAGYQAQGLQCIVLGQATREMRELARYAAEIWHSCSDLVRPGKTPDEVIQAAEPIIERARGTSLGDLADGLWPVMPPAGLGGLDPFPPGGVIEPNQAFMLEMGPGGRPFGPAQHINGGVLVVSTDGAPRTYYGSHPIESRLLAEV